MIGLALQGGGARGSYQIGAYMALKKARIKFDGVCGTSIGSFNGAMIAARKEKELLKFWENVSIGKVLGFDSEYLTKKEAKEYDLKYLKLGIKNMVQIIKSRGIPTSGLEKELMENLKIEELMNSKMDFGLCTVRLKDLKPLYIFKEEMKKEKLYDYILASCYLPLFRMEKKVDDNYYLDGGFYDNTPINMLVKKGYKKIYVIELNPLINRNQKIKDGQDVEIIRITPKRSLGAVLIYDQNILRDNIKMGYYDTLKVIKKVDGEYYCFKKYPDIFYDWLMRKINRKTKKRIMGFFNAKTNKEAIINALEYIMKEENKDYYKIYNPYSIIKKIKKNNKKRHFVYEFVRSLKFM